MDALRLVIGPDPKNIKDRLMPTIAQVLERYKTLFENLNLHSLEEDFLQVFSTDVTFKDPFNQVRGLTHLQHIFQDMFSSLEQPQFRILDFAGCNNSGFLEWQLTFKLKAQGATQLIQGVSKITINPHGQVCSHIDYWDTGEYVYAKVPLLGPVIRLINKRLSSQ